MNRYALKTANGALMVYPPRTTRASIAFETDRNKPPARRVKLVRVKVKEVKP